MLVESEGNLELDGAKRGDNWIEVRLQDQLLMWAWDLCHKICCGSLPQEAWPTTLRRRVSNLLCELCGAENSNRWIGRWLSCALPKFTLQSWTLIHLATECFFWQTTFYWVSLLWNCPQPKKAASLFMPNPNPPNKTLLPWILSIKWLGVKMCMPDSLLWSRDILKSSSNSAAY